MTRFHPYLKLSHLHPTPVSTLEEARKKGMDAGLHYVYLGNVPGQDGENTYCHHCGSLLIKRYIFDILENRIMKGRCPECDTRIPGRF